jgi:hypothetical protein
MLPRPIGRFIRACDTRDFVCASLQVFLYDAVEKMKRHMLKIFRPVYLLKCLWRLAQDQHWRQLPTTILLPKELSIHSRGLGKSAIGIPS